MQDTDQLSVQRETARQRHAMRGPSALRALHRCKERSATTDQATGCHHMATLAGWLFVGDANAIVRRHRFATLNAAAISPALESNLEGITAHRSFVHAASTGVHRHPRAGRALACTHVILSRVADNAKNSGPGHDCTPLVRAMASCNQYNARRHRRIALRFLAAVAARA